MKRLEGFFRWWCMCESLFSSILLNRLWTKRDSLVSLRFVLKPSENAGDWEVGEKKLYWDVEEIKPTSGTNIVLISFLKLMADCDWLINCYSSLLFLIIRSLDCFFAFNILLCFSSSLTTYISFLVISLLFSYSSCFLWFRGSGISLRDIEFLPVNEPPGCGMFDLLLSRISLGWYSMMGDKLLLRSVALAVYADWMFTASLFNGEDFYLTIFWMICLRIVTPPFGSPGRISNLRLRINLLCWICERSSCPSWNLVAEKSSYVIGLFSFN